MPEQLSNTSILLNRFKWYEVNRFLRQLSTVSEELHLEPKDLVHIGGTSVFYRLLQVFGPRTVFHFRGTKDMDLISFRQGTIQQVIERMANLPDAPITNYHIQRAYGLPNKKSIFLQFTDSNNIRTPEQFKIDVYETPFGTIRFNNRLMAADKIVMDPPEKLELPTSSSSATIPTLRDAFIIKTDIIDSSESGFRPKDRLDILTNLTICAETGVDFRNLLEALSATNSPDSALAKLAHLEDLFTTPTEQIGLPVDYPFIPNFKQINQALKDVRRIKDNILRITEP